MGDIGTALADVGESAGNTRLGKFLTGQGTQESFIAKHAEKPWLQALSETVPGMKAGIGLSQIPLGKYKGAHATLGSAYGPGSSILTRLMRNYTDTTSPAMPGYPRKSLRRRIT